MNASPAKSPRPPISISQLAGEVGLTRAEVRGILHEHDVPVQAILQGRLMLLAPADVDRIKPVLERTYQNKLRRTEIVSRSC